MNQHIYKVGGMNCHSCEVLIKERLEKLPGIKYVEVSKHREEVLIEHEQEKPSLEKLNDIFKEEKFVFSDLDISEPLAETVKEAQKQIHSSGQKQKRLGPFNIRFNFRRRVKNKRNNLQKRKRGICQPDN